MTFKAFELSYRNHFVAMEYYYLVFNRTFLVLLTRDYLIGIQGNGLISTLSIQGNLDNPSAYILSSYLDKMNDVELLDGSIIKANKVNFMIKKADIKNVYHNPEKKYGMGPYPHDGRVIVETIDNKKREFIILGNQYGQDVVDWILANENDDE